MLGRRLRAVLAAARGGQPRGSRAAWDTAHPARPKRGEIKSEGHRRRLDAARTPTPRAPDVDMELVQPWVIAVVPELNLELQAGRWSRVRRRRRMGRQRLARPRYDQVVVPGACRSRLLHEPSRGGLVRLASRLYLGGPPTSAPRATSGRPSQMPSGGRQSRQADRPDGRHAQDSTVRTRRADQGIE